MTTNDKLIAALERTLRTLDAITVDDESRADARIIRAHIETLRNGGIAGVIGAATVVGEKNGAYRERAQIVAWLEDFDPQLADAIEAGAHLTLAKPQSEAAS